LEVAALIQDMHYLAAWFQTQRRDPRSQALVDAVEAHLDSARYYLSRRFGANPISILGHLEAAQADLLQLAPLSYVRGSLPRFVMQARGALDADDLQLRRLENLEKNEHELNEEERQTIIACLKGAGEHVRRKQSRLQSFRNVIVATASFLLFLALVLGVASFRQPTLIPICFVRNVEGHVTIACPAAQSSPFPDIASGEPIEDIDAEIQQTVSPRDVLLVEFVGLLAAAIAAALAIRNLRGTSDPYGIPVALAFLKLPTGALTAVFGLILIRAGLVPGIETLDTSAEIIAWALVFGFGQQLFTGVVDRQARSVLEQSGASDYPSDRTAPPQ
jgi:hypothetical protein